MSGRALNVGRLRGYVDPAAPLATSMLGSMMGGAMPSIGQQPMPIAAPPPPPAGGAPSTCIKLEGMLKHEDLEVMAWVRVRLRLTAEGEG